MRRAQLATPYVSGNVSLYNQSKSGRTVAPSPIVACVGAIDDIAHSAALALKEAGSPLYFLGVPGEALGGSVYAALVAARDLMLPDDRLRARRARARLCCRPRFAPMLVLAAHDVSDGGVLVALAKMAFASRDGARSGIRLEPSPLDGSDGFAAYAEACGFVVEVSDEAAFTQLAARADVSVVRLGHTDAAFLLHLTNGRALALDELYEVWSEPLRDFYAPVPVEDHV